MEPLFRLVMTCLMITASFAAPSRKFSATSSKPGRGFGTGGSPHDYGLRESGPHDPPVDLIESPNKMYDPKTQDLNVTALRQKLGRSFDPEYMSISKPLELNNRHHHGRNRNQSMIDYPFKRNKKGRLVPLGDMPRSLKRMNFKYIRLPDGTKLRTRVTNKLKKKLQQFLWAYTSCPVVYRWKDIGIRFWPRWIKEGHCPPGKSSCSIPPGMKCKPSGTIHKSILRWHCEDWAQSKYCKWITIHYPIVTQCSCSCANGGGNNSNSYS